MYKGATEREAHGAEDENVDVAKDQGNVGADVGSNCESDMVKNNGNGLDSSAGEGHGLRNGDNDVGKDDGVDGESETDKSYVGEALESDDSDVEFEPLNYNSPNHNWSNIYQLLTANYISNANPTAN